LTYLPGGSQLQRVGFLNGLLAFSRPPKTRAEHGIDLAASSNMTRPLPPIFVSSMFREQLGREMRAEYDVHPGGRNPSNT
jgi:hypothetical protein